MRNWASASLTATLSLFASLALAAPVRESTSARSCELTFTRSLATPIDSRSFFDALASNGIAKEGLRMTLERGEGAQVTLYYRGESIGSGQLQYNENANHAGRIYIDSIRVNDDFTGKGLGLLLYMGLAKQAYLEGKILESSHDLNTDSTSVWQRLVKSGVAKKVDSQFFEMRMDVLESLEFQFELDTILSEFKLRPGETVFGHRIQSRPP